MDKIDKQFRHNPKYLKLSKPLEAAEICDAARSLSDCRFDVVSFKQGLLTLAVANSAEAFELQMNSVKVIKNINKKIGKNAVERIRIKLK